MKKVAFILVICMLIGCAGCAGTGAGTQSRPAEEILKMEGDVRRVLQTSVADVTAKSVCMTDDAPAHTGYLLGWKEASVSYPFAKMMEEFPINPIAAFFELENHDLYSFTWEDDEIIFYELSHDEYAELCKLQEGPVRDTVKEYRCRRDEEDFFRDVLQTSALLNDGIGLEEQILRKDANLDFTASEEEQVSYAYYIYTTDLFAQVLCVYIHYEEGQELIEDVELQLLTLNYNTYRENAPEDEDPFDLELGQDMQLLALIDAVELNLTGTSLFHLMSTMRSSAMHGGSADIPFEYGIGEYDVTIHRKNYESFAIGTSRIGDGYETAVLTTYRIQK